jgi:hypothetical protein
MVVSIQTHGELSQWHPHLHALATDGAFAPAGTFIPLPQIAVEPFLKLWEKKVFDLLLAEGRITPEVVQQMRTWQHSGFSVDNSVRLAAGDTAGIERLAQYMVRCPFSLERIVSVNPQGKVIYRAEKPDCRPFPILGNERLFRGVPRNFEVFDPLDFIAEITQHIPEPRAQQIRYYGWYSNAARGHRAKVADSAVQAPVQPVIEDDDTSYRKLCRMRWAALVKRVYEADPLKCPKCGATMKIVAFLERRDQPAVVERILKHCGLWDDHRARAPPKPPIQDQLNLEVEYIDTEAFLQAL